LTACSLYTPKLYTLTADPLHGVFYLRTQRGEEERQQRRHSEGKKSQLLPSLTGVISFSHCASPLQGQRSRGYGSISKHQLHISSSPSIHPHYTSNSSSSQQPPTVMDSRFNERPCLSPALSFWLVVSFFLYTHTHTHTHIHTHTLSLTASNMHLQRSSLHIKYNARRGEIKIKKASLSNVESIYSSLWNTPFNRWEYFFLSRRCFFPPSILGEKSSVHRGQHRESYQWQRRDE